MWRILLAVFVLVALAACATPPSAPESSLAREPEPAGALALGWGAFDRGIEGYVGAVDVTTAPIRLEPKPVRAFTGRSFDVSATTKTEMRTRGTVIARGALLVQEESLFPVPSPTTGVPFAVLRTTIDPRADRAEREAAFPGVRPDQMAAGFASLQAIKQTLETVVVPGIYAPRTVYSGELLHGREELRSAFVKSLQGAASVVVLADERVVGLTTVDGRRAALVTLTGSVRLLLSDLTVATLLPRGYGVIDLETGLTLRAYVGTQIDYQGRTIRTLHDSSRVIVN